MQAASIARNASGVTAITGTFSGTGQFGGAGIGPVGIDSGFAAGFGDELGYRWSMPFTAGGSVVRGFGVAVTPAGETCVVGRFSGTLDFGVGTLASIGGNDPYLVRVDVGGTARWAKTLGSGANEQAYVVAAMGESCVVGSEVGGDVDVGNGNLPARGASDGLM